MNRADRRKAKKKTNLNYNGGAVSVSWGQYTGIASNTGDPKLVPQEIPGVNIPPLTPEFDGLVSRNRWHDRAELDEVIQTIQTLSHKDCYEADGNTLKPGRTNWSWARNYKCKYVNVRVDMRDGGFIITNDEGERINLEHLKWQYKSPNEK